MTTNYIYTSTHRSLIIFVLVSIACFTSCSEEKDESSINTEQINSINDSNYKLTKIQFESSNMKIGKLELNTFNDIVKANGIFDVPPDNRATVSTYFGGTVTSIKLISGERVRKGQLLFTLENPDFVDTQQEYLEAKGKLTYLKSDFERQKKLIQDNVTSQKNYLKAESDYTVVSVKLKSLGKKLNLMGIDPKTLTTENIRTTIDIISPISGFVTDVNISRGAFLNPSQSAITIIDTDHLHLELKVFEKDLAKIKIGQPILFKTQDDNFKEYNAIVHLANKTIDPENRTATIHGHLLDDSLSSKFSPGVYLESDILTTSYSRNSLPKDALVEIEGKYYALLKASSTDSEYNFIKKEVQVGSSNNGYVEILNYQDFKGNPEVLIKGAFTLITE